MRRIPGFFFFVFIGLMLVAVEANGQNLINVLPASDSNFITTLRTFLSEEDAERYDELAAGVVITGGIHAAGAGLTKTPSSLIAYADGWRITETGSIVYPPSSTCVVIAGKATTGNVASFTRVTGTHYLIDCTGGARPALPNDSVWLMEVTTDGTGVTVVEDLRGRRPTAFIDAGEYESLAAAVTAIGSDSYTLLVQSHLYVGANLTVPTNITLHIARGGQVEVGSGFTLTLAQPIVAGRYRIFAAGSVISFQSYLEVFPEWWGATTLDATDDAGAIESAITSLPAMASAVNCGALGGNNSCGGIVSLAAGRYNLTSTIDINTTATASTLVEEVTLQGTGRDATFLSYTGSLNAINVVGFDTNNRANGFRLKDFKLVDTGGSGNIGIVMQNLSDVLVENVIVSNFNSAAPTVRVLESIATGGSQNVDIAVGGDGIYLNLVEDFIVRNSSFISNNIGVYCFQDCDHGLIGPGNVFTSVTGAENSSVALVGPISRFRIEGNHFDTGLADGEGEVFLWNVDGVDVIGNHFADGDAQNWIYANALTSGPRNHAVNVEENYFDISEFGESGANLNQTLYLRNTSSGQIRGNTIEGSAVSFGGADIVLAAGTEKIVLDGNQAYIGASAIGGFAAGSARPVAISDANSSSVVIGSLGDPFGQATNPGIYASGAILSSRGGVQEARTNSATQSSFHNGTASLAITSGLGVTVAVTTSGWNSSEGVQINFPVGATTDADRVDFTNTTVTCAPGNYYTISFAARNSSGATAARDDITFQMTGAENLGNFVPQLDTNFNRYWFTTSRCIIGGAVNLRVYQNTAQVGALSVLVDAVQVEVNAESPGGFISDGTTATAFDGFILSHGGMALSARIQTISGNVTFDFSDGAILDFEVSGGTIRTVSPTGNFPIGQIVFVHNRPSSGAGFIFDPTGMNRYLPANTGLVAEWNGGGWRRVAITGPGSATGAELAVVLANYANGESVYCSTCNPDATCTGGGPGALAFRIAGAWACELN